MQVLSKIAYVTTIANFDPLIFSNSMQFMDMDTLYLSDGVLSKTLNPKLKLRT